MEADAGRPDSELTGTASVQMRPAPAGRRKPSARPRRSAPRPLHRVGTAELAFQLVAEGKKMPDGGGVDGVLDQVLGVSMRLARYVPAECEDLAAVRGHALLRLEHGLERRI